MYFVIVGDEILQFDNTQQVQECVESALNDYNEESIDIIQGERVTFSTRRDLIVEIDFYGATKDGQ